MCVQAVQQTFNNGSRQPGLVSICSNQTGHSVHATTCVACAISTPCKQTVCLQAVPNPSIRQEVYAQAGNAQGNNTAPPAPLDV
jgi:hypothetical protein